MWPFTRKRAITAFRFRTEFRLEPVWKPFERNLHSFERPGSSVQKNLHPFERLDHPFDRNVQPFEWLAHPFGKSIHPFERLAHPFDKNVQPFERLTHPFVKNIQPFERLAHPFAGTSIRSNDLSMRQSYERLTVKVIYAIGRCCVTCQCCVTCMQIYRDRCSDTQPNWTDGNAFES